MGVNPLDCRLCTWKNSDLALPLAEQIAALLGHTEEAHCDGIPEAVREQIRACRKEIEKLPV